MIDEKQSTRAVLREAECGLLVKLGIAGADEMITR
jgi:hypothetical protein